MLRSLTFLALAGSLLAGVPGAAQHRPREQDEARDAFRAGQVMSLRNIEARVLPTMRGSDYIGPEFDARSATYRLKFMRSGSVIWVDVDARTGRIVGRSGY